VEGAKEKKDILQRSEGYKVVILCTLERRVILEPGNASYASDRKTEFRVSHMTGGLSVFVASSQDTLPGNPMLPMSRMGQELLDSPQVTINKQDSEFLISGMANNLCRDGSVSDSFYDIIRDDLFVDVNHSCVVVKGRL